MKNAQRRKYHEQMAELIELTNDEDELIDMLANAVSLCAMATNDLAYRQTEARLIKTKLKKVRENAEGIRVTDHAIVRYLERVVGMDIEACRKEILSKIPDSFNWADRKVEYLKIDVDGLQYVMRDKLVITVSPVEPKAKP